MTPPFKLFPKISATSYGPESVRGGSWVALEKIHGAQLVIAVSEHEIRFGKRKAWLADGESFFGWQLLRQALADKARAMYDSLALPGSLLTIYGELFGGGYPSPSVLVVPGLTPVQTGVWYAPDLHYAVFDVHLSPTAEAEGEFLSYTEVSDLATSAALLLPPLLQKGPRQTLEQLPVRFMSHVPALFGLPPLEQNWAEGYVLKADARSTLSDRAVLKRKIAEFDEQMFDESRPWNPQQMMTLEELKEWATRLVNGPRVASARSKWGATDMQQLFEEVALDVLVDIELAFPTAFQALSSEDEELLRSHVRALAVALMEGAL
ncbi:MAG: hypothetical protein MUD01_11390 [Chloroflexaceae bacterium]|nr:hypothetical protein [Chloroflexaceae bacterium]